MMDALVKDIPHAERGVRRAAPRLSRRTRACGPNTGNWYQRATTDMEGSLSPALAKYFPEPPAMLYARAELL